MTPPLVEMLRVVSVICAVVRGVVDLGECRDAFCDLEKVGIRCWSSAYCCAATGRLPKFTSSRSSDRKRRAGSRLISKQIPPPCLVELDE